MAQHHVAVMNPPQQGDVWGLPAGVQSNKLVDGAKEIALGQTSCVMQTTYLSHVTWEGAHSRVYLAISAHTSTQDPPEH